MAKSSWRAWLAAAALLLACVSPARSDVIDFEDVVPNIFGPDEGFVTHGFQFTVISEIGVVDSAAAFVFGNAPPNAAGQFAAMLNGGLLAMETVGGNPFLLQGFDAAFIAPLGEIGVPGATAGELGLLGITAVGTVFFVNVVLPAADLDGNFPFGTFLASQIPELADPLFALGFFGCVYDGQDCRVSDNLAQFALDNLRVFVVTEGSSLALLMLGLALAGAACRRHPR